VNERIKELWDLSRNPSGRGHDEQKFAELIVQECVNVLHDNELWTRDVSHVLREHFGVEA
jgi:hypothetical protein